MKIKLLRAAVVNGSVWPVDAVVDVEDAEAVELIGVGAAEVVPETPTAAPSAAGAASPPNTAARIFGGETKKGK